MNNVVLYSNHCPKCEQLQKRLNEAKINYIENNNLDEMRNLNIKSVPCLSVDGQIMNFSEAWTWATRVKNGN